MRMQHEVNVNLHIHYHHSDKIDKILEILRQFQEEGVKVAESPEVTAFREAVTASLSSISSSLVSQSDSIANVSADIQRLLARNPGLSEEDKAALLAIQTNAASAATAVADSATALAQVAAVVPEDSGEPPTARRR